MNHQAYKIQNHSDDFRNYNSAHDWLYLIKKGYKIWYQTGEYDAISPNDAFIEMLKKVGYDKLNINQIENLGYGWLKKFQNVAVAQLNDSGQMFNFEKPEISRLIMQRFINDFD